MAGLFHATEMLFLCQCFPIRLLESLHTKHLPSSTSRKRLAGRCPLWEVLIWGVGISLWTEI